MEGLQFTEFPNLPEGVQTTAKTLRNLENSPTWVKYLHENNLKSYDLIDINSFDTLLWLFLHLKLLHKTERYAALKIILEKLISQSLSAQWDLARLVETISLSAPEDEEAKISQEDYKLVLLTALIAHLFNTHNSIPWYNDDKDRPDISRSLKEKQWDEIADDEDYFERDDRLDEDENEAHQWMNLLRWSDPLDDRRGKDSPYLAMDIEDILESDTTDLSFRQFCLCMDELRNLDPQRYVKVVTTIVNGMQWKFIFTTQLSGIEELEGLLRSLIKEPKKLPMIKLLLKKARKTSDDSGAQLVGTLQDWRTGKDKLNNGHDEIEFIA